MSRWLFNAIILLTVGGQVSFASAQPFRPQGGPEISLAVQLDEADNVSRSHLERVDRFLEAGGWDEAIETLRRVMDTAGDKMMQVPTGSPNSSSSFYRYVTLRNYCQMLLVSLHTSAPEALELYRSRVDPVAERLYRQAVEDRDEEVFRRIVDLYFASRWGDDALLKLGELEFGRGNFTQARAAWERISPLLRTQTSEAADPAVPPGYPLWLALDGVDLDQAWQTLEPQLKDVSGRPRWLAFPDTDIDLADVRARLVLASIMEGSNSRAALELTMLERLDPVAEGVIGGRPGKYVDLLRDLLEESGEWSATRMPDDWMTFGGAPTRAKTADDGVDIALRPIWTFPLPARVARIEKDNPLAQHERVGESHAGLLSYHPLIVGDTVLICTGEETRDIHALHLHSGQSLWPREADTGLDNVDGNTWLRLLASQPHYGVPRFTMTAHQNMLFAKLGPYATTIPQSARYDPIAPGYLVALDLRAQKKRLFEIRLTKGEWGTGWAFDGPPLIEDADIYVVMRQRDNMKTQIHVTCFRMKPNRAEFRWGRWVASAETLGQGQTVEYTHNLLTLDQGVVYVNTNQGAVAAVGAQDGTVLWVTRYPRAPAYEKDARRPNPHAFRDLTPCLVQKDIVVVAPRDCDQIFALDAATGMVLWQTGPERASNVIHLLGIANGQLIASGHRLYWIDLYDGQITRSFPARVQDDLRGYGRGIVAGDSVYWPTRGEIYVFDVRTMRMKRQPINLSAIGMSGGNLLVADGVMLVAGADKLAAFNAYGRQIGPSEDRMSGADRDSSD